MEMLLLRMRIEIKFLQICRVNVRSLLLGDHYIVHSYAVCAPQSPDMYYIFFFITYVNLHLIFKKNVYHLSGLTWGKNTK